MSQHYKGAISSPPFPRQYADNRMNVANLIDPPSTLEPSQRVSLMSSTRHRPPVTGPRFAQQSYPAEQWRPWQTAEGHRSDLPSRYSRPPAYQPSHYVQTRPTHQPYQYTYQEPSPKQYSTIASTFPCDTRSFRHSPSSGGPARTSFPPPDLEYRLVVRQEPAAARACGFGERDRRVIDPPPIIELRIQHRKTGSPMKDDESMIALNCTLLSRDGGGDETEQSEGAPGIAPARRLMGTTIASPFPANDEHGKPGVFFVFSDLSCRSPGEYRLKFKLIRIDSTNLGAGSQHAMDASVITGIFKVYTAKDFPGMQASSSLLKALRDQGLGVGIKKGSDARKSRFRARKDVEISLSSSEEDEDDEDDLNVVEARDPRYSRSSTKRNDQRRPKRGSRHH